MDRLDVKRVEYRELLAHGRARLCASQVMTQAPSCIAPQTSALELVRMLHQKQFRHLLVTDPHGTLLGVISDRDVIRCLGPEKRPNKAALQAIYASQLMSTDLVTIAPDTPLIQAVTMMLDYGISCLPVLADGKLLGIVTNTDLHLILEALLLQGHAAAPSRPAHADVV